jgi:hypothetical protein
VLEHRLAVCRLEHDSEIPASATGAPFFCVTRTAGELSVDYPEELIPAGTACERGWRAIGVEGPLEFGLTGVLASLAVPLAESKVGILAIAKSQLDLAAQTLRERGHEVHEL